MADQKRRFHHRWLKLVMKSYPVRLPLNYYLPIRIRPWFIAFTFMTMLILAFLGFSNFTEPLPLNDKFLHFICFLIATTLFYFIFDVEEDSRRIWFWRHSGLILTAITCFLVGGILSEFVQGMLPYRTFQVGDIMANLLGSSIGLYLAYNMERYYRHRREIARLYRPLDMDALSDEDDDEDDITLSTQLLPTHYTQRQQQQHQNQQNPQQQQQKGHAKGIRLGNVWDEREDSELFFSVGEDTDDEEGSPSDHHNRRTDLPKITVTNS